MGRRTTFGATSSIERRSRSTLRCHAIQWCRFAQPPANGCDAFGIMRIDVNSCCSLLRCSSVSARPSRLDDFVPAIDNMLGSVASVDDELSVPNNLVPVVRRMVGSDENNILGR